MSEPLPATVAADEPILRVEDLKVHFPVTKGILIQHRVATVKAVDGVSFTIRRGETLGLVGESGSGKSTTGLAVLRMLTPTAGRIIFEGLDIAPHKGAELLSVRRRMQMVYQDPYGSLNPRMTIRNIVGEPLAVHGLDGDKAATRDKVAALIASVGLLPDMADRYPHEFSGGPRHRARAEPANRRRAGIRPRRFDPGAGHQPVHGSAGAPGPYLPVHRPRSGRGAAHLDPHRRDVSRAHRGDRGSRRSLSQPAAPLHRGTDGGGAGCRSGGRSAPASCRHIRRGAKRAQAAAGMQLPYPLPARHAGVQDRPASAAQHRPGARGRVPSPRELIILHFGFLSGWQQDERTIGHFRFWHISEVSLGFL